MMQHVISYILCRCPRDDKMEGKLVPEAKVRDPIGRQQTAPLAKEHLILSPWHTNLVLDAHAHERRKKFETLKGALPAPVRRNRFEGRCPPFIGRRR
jgi:hypothetical protein